MTRAEPAVPAGGIQNQTSEGRKPVRPAENVAGREATVAGRAAGGGVTTPRFLVTAASRRFLAGPGGRGELGA